jgi:hypothetical protein
MDWESPGISAAKTKLGQTATCVSGAVVDRVNRAHPQADIIAVAHFGVILTQVQRALDVTHHKAMSLSPRQSHRHAPAP